MRWLVLCSVAAMLVSCNEDSPVVVTPDTLEPAILATSNPGEVVLTNLVEAPVGFLIVAEATMRDVRWPRCTSLPVQVPAILQPRSELHVPAASIDAYAPGDSAVIHYKVLSRYSGITTAEFYSCVREGKVVLTLQ